MHTIKFSALTAAILLSSASFAATQLAPDELGYSQRGLSVHGNPAAAAATAKINGVNTSKGGMVSISGGIEYGNLDDLFDVIDNISREIVAPINGESSPSESQSSIDIAKIIDENPEADSALKALVPEVLVVGGLLAVIAEQGYGTAHIGLDIPFVISDDIYGGSLMFKIQTLGSSKAVGITEGLNFDEAQAKAALENILAIDHNTPSTEFDLSAGVKVQYDQNIDDLSLRLENESLLLVKAADIFKMSVGYSRSVYSSDSGNLFLGVEPTFYRVGLTNINVSLGDLTDSQVLFDNIRDTDFKYQNAFDADIGLIWSANHYELGASIKNLIEMDFDYPNTDFSQFSSEEVKDKLIQETTYVIERQGKVEGAIFTLDRRWSLNMAIELNAVSDPMQNEYQWASVNVGYASDSWWLPGARLGYRQNLAGTELGYLSAGITFAKYINLGVSSTLDTVNIDGVNVMRGLTANLGLQFEY
ncbi:conjugal transfer protein TraF [Colwellia echini]|nr:conjugal transfer protein TraF [Colwellia echini]